MVSRKLLQLFFLAPPFSSFICTTSCSLLSSSPDTSIVTMSISGNDFYNSWDYKKYSVRMPQIDFTKAPYTNAPKDSSMLNDLGNIITANCFINSLVFTIHMLYPPTEGWTVNALTFSVVYNSIKHTLSINYLLTVKNADELNYPERTVHWWSIKPTHLCVACVFTHGANNPKSLWYGQFNPPPIFEEDTWFRYEKRDKDGNLIDDPKESWSQCNSFFVYPSDWHDVTMPEGPY